MGDKNHERNSCELPHRRFAFPLFRSGLLMSISLGFAKLPRYRRRNDLQQSSQSVRSVLLRNMEICGQKRDVSIRLVETSEKIQAARALINSRYAWRGYGSNHNIPSDAHHMTFTAEIGEKVIGTITLAVDSRRGLAVDHAFKDEIDGFRGLPGGKLCELTKFAFDSTVQSKELMAALFHTVFVYGHRTHGCTDLLIEVNPRHVRFYQTMLGFERVGAVRMNEGVAAPAQLMRLEVAAIRKQIDQFAGGARVGSRSLYPFFLSPVEESGIYQRLSRPAREVAPTRPRHAAINRDADIAAIIRGFGFAGVLAPRASYPIRSLMGRSAGMTHAFA